MGTTLDMRNLFGLSRWITMYSFIMPQSTHAWGRSTRSVKQAKTTAVIAGSLPFPSRNLPHGSPPVLSMPSQSLPTHHQQLLQLLRIQRTLPPFRSPPDLRSLNSTRRHLAERIIILLIILITHTIYFPRQP